MLEDIATRPGQLHPAARPEKVVGIAAHVEKSSPALASPEKVGAPERALEAASKLEPRRKVIRGESAGARGGRPSTDAASISGKGGRVDVRVY